VSLPQFVNQGSEKDDNDQPEQNPSAFVIEARSDGVERLLSLKKFCEKQKEIF